MTCGRVWDGVCRLRFTGLGHRCILDQNQCVGDHVCLCGAKDKTENDGRTSARKQRKALGAPKVTAIRKTTLTIEVSDVVIMELRKDVGTQMTLAKAAEQMLEEWAAAGDEPPFNVEEDA